MREIEFRAWDKEKKMWTNWKCYDNMFYFMDKNTGVWIRDDEFKRFILLQYTGLKDKISKEICEGDIVIWDNKIGYIGFLKQEMGYCIILKDTDFRLGHRNIGNGYDFNADIEIIGNIYENPELLE